MVGRNEKTLLALVCLWIAACGTARRGEPLTGGVRLTEPVAQRGALVFFEHCHQCHTGGESGLGPAINDKPLPGFLMKFQVRHGLGAMPAFDERRISDADLDALIEYLKSLRRCSGCDRSPRAGPG
jgi:mono/diheme cytochrome c family protein